MSSRVERPATAFSLDMGRKNQGGQIKDVKHLIFIRKLPCLVTLAQSRIEAAHVRYPDPAYKKPGTPMARKPDDCWVVPLSAEAHREGPRSQHASNERNWWSDLGIDPLEVAQKLYLISGDLEAGQQIIVEANAGLKPWRR